MMKILHSGCACPYRGTPVARSSGGLSATTEPGSVLPIEETAAESEVFLMSLNRTLLIGAVLAVALAGCTSSRSDDGQYGGTPSIFGRPRFGSSSSDEYRYARRACAGAAEDRGWTVERVGYAEAIDNSRYVVRLRVRSAGHSNNSEPIDCIWDARDNRVRFRQA